MRKYLKTKKSKSNKFIHKVLNGFVTICLTALMLWGLQAYSTSAGLKFVQISDIHYMENSPNTTFKMIGESPRLLDDAISQINMINDVDFVMVTGDLIDKPYEKELKSALEHLKKLNNPWYFAFGNHDRCVGGYLTTNVYLEILKSANDKLTFDKSYYSFTPKKGFKVIVLDDIITDEIISQGYIDDVQYNWLKKELDKSKNDTVLVFMHIPVVEPFASPNHRLRNSTKLLSLFESYKNPIGVFQGHYHAAKVTRHKNVLYVNTPALVSYPNAFRTVSVSNYKNKTVFELEWTETNEKTIQKMAKFMVLVPDIYAGTQSDKIGIYEIEK